MRDKQRTDEGALLQKGFLKAGLSLFVRATRPSKRELTRCLSSIEKCSPERVKRPKEVEKTAVYVLEVEWSGLGKCDPLGARFRRNLNTCGTLWWLCTRMVYVKCLLIGTEWIYWHFCWECVSIDIQIQTFWRIT